MLFSDDDSGKDWRSEHEYLLAVVPVEVAMRLPVSI